MFMIAQFPPCYRSMIPVLQLILVTACMFARPAKKRQDLQHSTSRSTLFVQLRVTRNGHFGMQASVAQLVYMLTQVQTVGFATCAAGAYWAICRHACLGRHDTATTSVMPSASAAMGPSSLQGLLFEHEIMACFGDFSIEPSAAELDSS